MSKAIDDVLAERKRQVDVEGFTARIDAEHDGGVLACVAAAYLLNAADHLSPYSQGDGGNALPSFWPLGWDASLWRPKSPRRDLVRAAALAIAEIEKLDVANSTDASEPHVANASTQNLLQERLLASLESALRYIEVSVAYEGYMTAADVEATIKSDSFPSITAIGANSCNTLAQFDISKARKIVADAKSSLHH